MFYPVDEAVVLLLVVVSLARTSHQPASRTLPTCLQACLQAALHVQSAALQLSQPRKERGVHRPKGDQATIVSSDGAGEYLQLVL